MELTLLDAPGARCLDGSPAGFYHRRGRQDRWVLYLEGGGWCYTPAQCRHRARNEHTGSSLEWPRTWAGAKFGPLSDSATINPEFHDASHVFVKYCDGASFAGNSDLETHGMTLFFRGRRILASVLSHLQQAKYGLGASVGTELLLAGCSAGGLAVILNADRVRLLLPPTVTKFKAVAGSGFFVHAPNAAGDDIIGWQMRQVYFMQNLSATLSVGCQRSQPLGEEWRCVMAPYAVAHVRTPLFVIDSTIDKWQLLCTHNARALPQDSYTSYMAACGTLWPHDLFSPCLSGWDASLIADCTAERAGSIRDFATAFSAQIASTGLLGARRPHGPHELLPHGLLPHGLFLTTCDSHCGLQYADWFEARLSPVAGSGAASGAASEAGTTAVQAHSSGSVVGGARSFSMQQALGLWWRDDQSGASAHTYLPCELNEQWPYQCNPTCPDVPGLRSGRLGALGLTSVGITCALCACLAILLRVRVRFAGAGLLGTSRRGRTQTGTPTAPEVQLPWRHLDSL